MFCARTPGIIVIDGGAVISAGEPILGGVDAPPSGFGGFSFPLFARVLVTESCHARAARATFAPGGPAARGPRRPPRARFALVTTLDDF